MASGGASASAVPDDLRLPWMCGSHLEDQRGEARSVARWWSPVISPTPTISRRSHKRRRAASVDHGRVDLAKKKVTSDVQKMRHEEEKREWVKGEAGDVVRWSELATYRRRAAEQNEQPGGVEARVFGAKGRGRRGVYMGERWGQSRSKSQRI